MSKRLLLAGFLLLVGAVAGWLLARVPVGSGTTGDIKLEPAGFAWPADQAWTWSFNPPRDITARSRIALRFRAKPSTLAPDENPVIGGGSAPMSAEEAEVEFGAGDLVPGDVRPELWSGRVNVQLLDLASAAVASAKPGKDLRLMANLDIGGSRVNLNPDHTVLPGNRIAGHVRHGDGRWKNNELYLMSFAVEDGRKLWHYDVFVEHKSASIRN